MEDPRDEAESEAWARADGIEQLEGGENALGESREPREVALEAPDGNGGAPEGVGGADDDDDDGDDDDGDDAATTPTTAKNARARAMPRAMIDRGSRPINDIDHGPRS
eukprot:3440872-Pyramimonas_sp.AAC.1